ncbi:Crp/Fnr family transcriptional regulator [Virgibacillus sp. MSJ-26]|uniref:Crp/Fnr family transcriptional regulator n=1 Tax=Virgibacillus sp. MSJ-26 TaxID=2841522 RepID=UPI001C10E4C4|nr:Crp/Fnr family transcriptional regulator [Virgibacillus sp. MSJ-26]MBU5467231.1 Crp/Fnr family transcriptional regulator [Virgibacillus sp. MSJ-26]
MAESCCHHNAKSKHQMCISKVPIFNHLEEEEMREILKKSSQKVFQKGEIIYHEGDPLEYLYIVHVGRVKIYKLFESGKEQLLRILEPGEFLGELALFTDKVMDSYAEAIVKSEICAIHKSDIQELMKTHPTIPLKILSEFSERLDETEYLVGQLSARDVETRTASYLVKLAEDKNTLSVVLPMSKKDLASYLGTTQETISRRLSYFQTKGWIEQVGHRKINILDLNALKNAAEDF